MCYLKPGPRCSSSAKKNLEEALLSGDNLKIAKARQEYMLTPAGIDELRSKGHHETADIMENKRQELIAESKSQAASKENSEYLSQEAMGYYIPPNEYHQDVISGYYDRDQDTLDVLGMRNETDFVFHYQYLYAMNDVALMRQENTDFPENYQAALEQSEAELLRGNLGKARQIMSAWSTVKTLHFAPQLAEEASITHEQAYNYLDAWEKGNRDSIVLESHRAFGGVDSYDRENPAHRFLSAQYHRTQAYLEENAVGTVRIYQSGNYPLTAGINSATLDESIARASADDETYYADVPSSRIVSLPQTGMGSAPYREVVTSSLDDIPWVSQNVKDNPEGINDGFHQ